MSAFFLGHPKETDLALFAGGESGPFARWRIERHVERCPQCQEIAADFFRLPDQLNELAELPSVDWKQMAMAIEAGVLADTAAGQPVRRSGFPPLVWQAGLAAATVAVIVMLQFSEATPEPEMVAAARIEAPPPAYVVDEAPLDDIPGEVTTTVDDFPESAEVATATLQSKAREERQTLASDIAAPAAPPPPPAAVRNEAASARSVVAAEAIAPAAESAEVRLRSDAASRVGAVAALGSAAPAVADQVVGFRQARVAWAQLPVETVNFDGAPLSLSGGSTASAGVIAKTPTVAATNRSGRSVSSFELTWIVGEGNALATARVERQGVSMAAGAVNSSGGDRSWRLPDGIVSAKMRIYVSNVRFDDGTGWSPTSAAIAVRGLIAAGAAYPQLELLPLNYESDDKP